MSIEAFIRQIRERIAGGQLGEALPMLRAMLQHTPQLNEAIQQSARYEDICRQTRLGIAGSEETGVALNQIRWGVLELLSKLEEQNASGAFEGLLEQVETLGRQAALQQEVEHAISIVNSKNVVAGSELSAGGNIHIGDIIYQSEKASAQPGTKHEYNKKLTRLLVETMAGYSEQANRLTADFSWLDQPADLRKVQNFICRSFIGEVGKQLRDLINIGDYEDLAPEKKQRHYVEKILDIARRTFDVVNYALLSVWWDKVKINPLDITPAHRAVLSACFDKHFEHSLEQQFHLLQTLHALFVQHNIAFPFRELPNSATQLEDGSPLHKACTALQDLPKSPCTPADCDKAELLLGEIIRPFAFLILYRMASIKKIGYRQIRNDDPRYLHRYVALGLDKKYSEDAEKLNYSQLGEQTPAVLLYRGDDYQNGINLFPFIIDYNALTFEQGAKVCFFSATDLSDGALEYRFLGDNSIIRIEKTGILKPDTDLNELLLQTDNLKILNLDCVVDGFKDARRAVLGAVEPLNLDEL